MQLLRLDHNGQTAVAAMRRAVDRGASRTDLVCAAAACARAVLRAIPTGTEDVVLALESTELWLVEGSPFQVQAALAAQSCAARILRREAQDLAPAERHATIAAIMAATATLGGSSDEHAAVRAVEHAARAALLLGIDLSASVTAALL